MGGRLQGARGTESGVKWRRKPFIIRSASLVLQEPAPVVGGSFSNSLLEVPFGFSVTPRSGFGVDRLDGRL